MGLFTCHSYTTVSEKSTQSWSGREFFSSSFPLNNRVRIYLNYWSSRHRTIEIFLIFAIEVTTCLQELLAVHPDASSPGFNEKVKPNEILNLFSPPKLPQICWAHCYNPVISHRSTAADIHKLCQAWCQQFQKATNCPSTRKHWKWTTALYHQYC